MTDQHTTGFYAKYFVARNDGRDQPGGDRAGAQYLSWTLPMTSTLVWRLGSMPAGWKASTPNLPKIFGRCSPSSKMIKMRGVKRDPPVLST